MSDTSALATRSLRSLGAWSGGGTPSKSNPAYWTGGTIPWVSPKDMKVARIRDAEDRITPDAIASSATSLVKAGAVVLVVRSGILKHSLPVAVTEVDVALNQDMKALQPADGVDAAYVAWALRANAQKILHSCSKAGTTVQSIEMPAFLDFDIPLPPPDGQRQVVAEVEARLSLLDASVADLHRVQANLKRYRACVLKAACEGRLVPTEAELARQEGREFETGEQLLQRVLSERREKLAASGKHKEAALPSTTAFAPLPEGWAWSSVEQINLAARPCAYGVLQPGNDLPDGVRLVRVGDINDGQVDTENLKCIDPTIAAAYPRTKLSGGEVLITLVGAIGRTAIVPKSLEGANTARAVGVIPLSPLLSARWVELWFRNPATVARMTAASHEVARKTLNLEDVRSAAVPSHPSPNNSASLPKPTAACR
jgi:type I restriction enzyme, S subunit